MLPAIETFQKPVQGVAITWPGTSDPIFLVPFPGQRLIGALATGAESVVFVGIRPGRGSGKTGTTVLARYERASSKAACRAEVASFIARSALSNQSGRSLFISGHEGIAVIDPASLVVSRRIELLRVIGDDVQTSSWDERDGGGHRTYELDSKRWGPNSRAGRP